METKFGNTEVQNTILRLLRETKMPVDVEFVAQKLGIGWGTARAILLNLVVEGKVRMEKTTKSFIFSLNEGEREAPTKRCSQWNLSKR
jgi:DNA-binding IclR family transcriptional regulator